MMTFRLFGMGPKHSSRTDRTKIEVGDSTQAKARQRVSYRDIKAGETSSAYLEFRKSVEAERISGESACAEFPISCTNPAVISHSWRVL
jgi:hypothetical protein